MRRVVADTNKAGRARAPKLINGPAGPPGVSPKTSPIGGRLPVCRNKREAVWQEA
jgi:hypothetical protein